MGSASMAWCAELRRSEAANEPGPGGCRDFVIARVADCLRAHLAQPARFRVSIGDHHAEIQVQPNAPEAYHQGMVQTAIAEVLRRASPGHEVPTLEGQSNVGTPADPGEISDGYHTFNELYRHRYALFAVACKFLGGWKSRLHADGTMFDGHFIAGAETPQGPVTYHMPIRVWGGFRCREFDRAPEWDGHTSQDVIDRLWSASAPEASQGSPADNPYNCDDKCLCPFCAHRYQAKGPAPVPEASPAPTWTREIEEALDLIEAAGGTMQDAVCPAYDKENVLGFLNSAHDILDKIIGPTDPAHGGKETQP